MDELRALNAKGSLTDEWLERISHGGHQEPRPSDEHLYRYVISQEAYEIVTAGAKATDQQATVELRQCEGGKLVSDVFNTYRTMSRQLFRRVELQPPALQEPYLWHVHPQTASNG
jgi:hypothetical protein